jgi:hypothetical protein
MLEVDGTGHTVPFFDVFYRLDLLKSGQHHPDGLLWFHTPSRRHAVHEGRVQLTSVLPTVLARHGAPIPDYVDSEPLPVD